MFVVLYGDVGMVDGIVTTSDFILELEYLLADARAIFRCFLQDRFTYAEGLIDLRRIRDRIQSWRMRNRDRTAPYVAAWISLVRDARQC